jgi:hypothetical protein
MMLPKEEASGVDQHPLKCGGKHGNLIDRASRSVSAWWRGLGILSLAQELASPRRQEEIRVHK